ncbi:MAG: cytochrome c-type biogenesis protein CcmH [Caldilineaceae bacterium]
MLWLLFCLNLIGLIQTLSIQAQNNPAQKGTVTVDEVNEVARQLWCPLCSGVRLDTCELQACEQMRQEIALKLQAGENADTIKQEFINQYGPQVMGEPPRSGFNWLAWILPFVVLLAGAIFLVMRGRRLLSPQSTTANAATAEAVKPAEEQADPYARRLEEELKRYD